MSLLMKCRLGRAVDSILRENGNLVVFIIEHNKPTKKLTGGAAIAWQKWRSRHWLNDPTSIV